MRYIVANWKQFKTSEEAVAWLEAFNQAKAVIPDQTTIVVAAAFVLLPTLRKYIDDHRLPIELAAQDLSPKDEGAFTGEVGAKQLKEYVQHVIIGHSERRMYFGETNQFVALKVRQALDQGLHAFVCIADQVYEDGRVPREKIEVKEAWFTQQITTIFEGIDPTRRNRVTLVYEPISAISTFGGQPLTGTQAVEAINAIKEIVAHKNEVMYGGSVNPANIREYWPFPEVAGVMPGGASLAVQEFLNVLNNAQDSSKQ
jgi:triosephosphate isomerase